jgi:hypothetical protein
MVTCPAGGNISDEPTTASGNIFIEAVRQRAGPNAVRWIDEEVFEWLKSRPAATQASEGGKAFSQLPVRNQ